jgi:hypothetical protein
VVWFALPSVACWLQDCRRMRADEDAAKCQSYGVKPGQPAYVVMQNNA